MEDEYDLASDDAPVNDKLSLDDTDLDFEDPEMDLQEGEEGEEIGEEVEGEEPETDEPEAEETQEPVEAAPVADDALVTLQDGQKISVGDLKRNNLFQQDYSRKTEELKRQVEQYEQDYSRKTENFQSHADALLQFASQIISEPSPQLANEDPHAYMVAKAEFDQKSAQYGRILEAAQQMKAQATQKQEAERMAQMRQQQAILKTRMPELADPVQHKAFVNDVIQFGEHYGYTAADVGAIENHVQFMVLKDAIAYRKLKSQGKETRQKVASKPKMKTRARSSENRASNAGAIQRLRKSGSIHDAMMVDFE